MHCRFRRNAPNVVSEVVDGEAIVMRLDTGTYYSLDGAGALAWRLLETSVPEEDVIAAVAAAFTGDRSQIAEAIHELVAALVERELIVPLDGSPAPPDERPASLPAGPRPAFEPPELREYTDMQDLLLVDPIHEVEEGGWPQVSPGSGDPEDVGA